MKVFTMYMVGLSGSGKTTLAAALEGHLRERGHPIQVIDGDILRRELGDMFGYTMEERLKQGRVAWVLAKYLNQNGVSVIITAVASSQHVREQARSFFDSEHYIQTYLACPLEECIRRDVKGYYKNMEQLSNFGGVDQPYEVPTDSEIVVDVVHLSVEESTKRILNYLQASGFC